MTRELKKVPSVRQRGIERLCPGGQSPGRLLLVLTSLRQPWGRVAEDALPPEAKGQAAPGFRLVPPRLRGRPPFPSPPSLTPCPGSLSEGSRLLCQAAPRGEGHAARNQGLRPPAHNRVTELGSRPRSPARPPAAPGLADGAESATHETLIPAQTARPFAAAATAPAGGLWREDGPGARTLGKEERPQRLIVDAVTETRRARSTRHAASSSEQEGSELGTQRRGSGSQEWGGWSKCPGSRTKAGAREGLSCSVGGLGGGSPESPENAGRGVTR